MYYWVGKLEDGVRLRTVMLNPISSSVLVTNTSRDRRSLYYGQPFPTAVQNTSKVLKCKESVNHRKNFLWHSSCHPLGPLTTLAPVRLMCRELHHLRCRCRTFLSRTVNTERIGRSHPWTRCLCGLSLVVRSIRSGHQSVLHSIKNKQTKKQKIKLIRGSNDIWIFTLEIEHSLKIWSTMDGFNISKYL